MTRAGVCDGSLRAHLLDDRGAAAVCAEFFRSTPFLRAEGVTHTLVLESAGDVLATAPLIVRDIPGTPYRDAASPYGYPGFTSRFDAKISPATVDWSSTGLVSIFIRDRLSPSFTLTGGTVRAEVCVIDPSIEVRFRKHHRTNIRRNDAEGYRSVCLSHDCLTDADRLAFIEVYGQTMRRNEANSRYLFSAEYFEWVFSFPGTWLIQTYAPNGDLAAGAIAVPSDGFLHRYLSGTADQYLFCSPAKNNVDESVRLGKKLSLPVNLGGGYRPGDGLEAFKRGFANTTAPFVTHEIVCDRDTYSELASRAPSDGFFPAYRGPSDT